MAPANLNNKLIVIVIIFIVIRQIFLSDETGFKD
jgi:hypothetical protein